MRISDWSSDVCSSDLAEQAVPLRLEGAVVDRLRLLDLAVGPAPDAFWRSQSDLDLVKRLRLRRGVHEVHQFLVHAQVLPDRKSTRLNPVTNAHLVCRLLLEKKKKKNGTRCKDQLLNHE